MSQRVNWTVESLGEEHRRRENVYFIEFRAYKSPGGTAK